MNTKKKAKGVAKKTARARKKQSTVGARIVEGLEQAIAWTRGKNADVPVTVVHVPEIDVRAVRTKMELSQAQFAPKFVSRRPRYATGNKAGRARTRPPACCWR